jgi:hypothetical protein
MFTVRDLSCWANPNAPQFWIGNTIAWGLNLGTTIVELTGIVLGGNSGVSPPHQTATGTRLNSGFTNVTGVHCEQMPSCVEVNPVRPAPGMGCRAGGGRTI